MTLHTLIATYNDPKAGKAYEDCYSYNDPKFDLIAEPFVHDATQAIVCAMAFAGLCKTTEPPSTIKLEFTNNSVTRQSFSDDDLIIQLTYDSYSEDSYNMYSSTLISPAEAALNSQIADDFCEAPLVPLCSHLFDYFLAAPKEIWARVSIPTK